ncbi:hypothetical protein [Kribbella sp. CA-293567]|uniref:hypothetical protein n=1 Tax=Kribbella sp. CA-293567 TaxID=3002436 RepID=UPI0022DDFC75|nr:hypothetical protein [Kribbella sp. CA-293567]WBQ04412.1 hypothetical protein OX958_31170 [Kribbella sp. CA-293567]
MGEVIVPGFGITGPERQRMHEAVEEAGKFFRRELLLATEGWPPRFLKERGLEKSLAPGATWKVGYAPDSWARLTDHLQKRGFELATLVRAGLTTWSDDGSAIDRNRDRIVFIARNERLAPVGIVGIDREGEIRLPAPESQVNRLSNSLVGLREQIDLLSGGAVPVIVDRPTDAMAIEQLSRATTKKYIGIPLCGSPVSTFQARILARYSETDQAIVMLPAETRESRQRATGNALDLALYFDRIQTVPLPRGDAMSTLAHTPSGRQSLLTHLSLARPLTGYRNGLNDNGTQHTSLEIDDPGPGLCP